MDSDKAEQVTVGRSTDGLSDVLPDILEDAVWRFASCAPGEAPSPVDALGLDWAEAVVPGTVAAALTRSFPIGPAGWRTRSSKTMASNRAIAC